ncbi:MAG: AlpA family transcriptional regulator [Terracidiphilus sp.]
MPSAHLRKATILNQSPEKVSEHKIPPTPFAARKIPQSQTAKTTLNGIPSNLDDVTFLRLPEVKAVTGLSKTSLYALIREGNFPASVRLGPRAVAWVKSEVKQWAVERVHASRSLA